MDKTNWPAGPWMDEPDWLDFSHAGFACVVRRAAPTGALCGYVKLPKGHPWHGADWDAVRADVHGGITWSKPELPDGSRSESDWWIGFDCAHAFDRMPALEGRGLSTAYAGSEYRDLAYARGECERLAEQARAEFGAVS